MFFFIIILIFGRATDSAVWLHHWSLCHLNRWLFLGQILHFPLMQVHRVIKRPISLLKVFTRFRITCLFTLSLICPVNRTLPPLPTPKSINNHYIAYQMYGHAYKYAAPQPPLPLHHMQKAQIYLSKCQSIRKRYPNYIIAYKINISSDPLKC